MRTKKTAEKMRLLNYLNKKQIIDLNNYYVVTFSDKITIQGDLTEKSLLDIQNLGFEIKSLNNWIQAENKNIKIILTLR